METWEIRCDIRDIQGVPVIRDVNIEIKIYRKLRGRITSGPETLVGGRVLFETRERSHRNRLLVMKNGDNLVIDVTAAVKTSAEP